MPAEIAVLISAYNPEKSELNETLESVLNSSVAVDVFLVDDGSKMVVSSLLETTTGRVFHIRLNENVGLTKALNVGLNRIKESHNYSFIARMDIGDICHPERFKIQQEYLETHPQLAGAGCWFKFFDAFSKEDQFTVQGPTIKDMAKIPSLLHMNSIMAHPAWLFRSNVFYDLNGYAEEYKVAQDYEFLMRAYSNGYTFVNVPEVLLSCSEYGNGISASRRKSQLLSRLKIQFKYFEFKNIYSYIGVVKTGVLLFVPAEMLRNIKKKILKTD